MGNNNAAAVGQKTISIKKAFRLPLNSLKILMVLAITITAYTGAVAQSKVKCAKDEKKVCKPTSGGNGVSCYETKHAQNYKVCKGKAGYYVCCHTPAEVTAYSIYTIDNSYDVYSAAFPEENNVVTTAETTISGQENTMDGTMHEKHVCKKAADGSTACYKTEYAKNYKICKGDAGYHICGTAPHK